MVARAKDLWSLALDPSEIDPEALVVAIENQVRRRDLDFRSRLLIRESLNALQQRSGPGKLQQWLEASPCAQDIEAIWNDDLGEPGFRSLARRIVETTRADSMCQLFRELGQALRLQKPVRLYVLGSGALILAGLLSRRTEAIDVVDELPQEIRSQRQVLDQLKARHHLYLGRFQFPNLPSGWVNRAQYLDTFGNLTVYLGDVDNVFLSKLVSSRTKDLDDLRMLLSRLQKNVVVERLRTTMAPLLADDKMHQSAVQNWYILYGEELPA